MYIASVKRHVMLLGSVSENCENRLRYDRVVAMSLVSPFHYTHLSQVTTVIVYPLSTLIIIIILILITGRNLDTWPPQRIRSKLFKRGGSQVDFFTWRFTRDLISVPAPLDEYTVLQLCSDYTQSFISPQNVIAKTE